MAEPSVRIPGIVLSSLLFEHINKDSDVEGLILGENHVEEHVTISDTQEDHVHLRRTSSVHKHVCCHKLDTWYDAAGRVDEEAVGRLLGANHRDLLIGWYRQRRNSERRMTMREKAVHENFRAALGVPHAIFLLVTPAALAEAGSTHRAEYSAFVSGNRSPWWSPTWRRWTIGRTGQRRRRAGRQATAAPSAATGKERWRRCGRCSRLAFLSQFHVAGRQRSGGGRRGGQRHERVAARRASGEPAGPQKPGSGGPFFQGPFIDSTFVLLRSR
ncbi:BRCA1-A complex subunit Abraxas 1 isoform 7-T7 [Syngnathus typhle]